MLSMNAKAPEKAQFFQVPTGVMPGETMTPTFTHRVPIQIDNDVFLLYANYFGEIQPRAKVAKVENSSPQKQKPKPKPRKPRVVKKDEVAEDVLNEEKAKGKEKVADTAAE